MWSKHLLVFFFGVMLLITPSFASYYQPHAYKPRFENSHGEKMSKPPVVESSFENSQAEKTSTPAQMMCDRPPRECSLP